MKGVDRHLAVRSEHLLRGGDRDAAEDADDEDQAGERD
jgi:hypothetical protein